ncbi:MAG: hypothetical protein U9N38_00160, partial [Thermodesulfobacteriota bacterium]|nr:hypothetical protein [Thermodesulfobacteriota bacterium]
DELESESKSVAGDGWHGQTGLSVRRHGGRCPNRPAITPARSGNWPYMGVMANRPVRGTGPTVA